MDEVFDLRDFIVTILRKWRMIIAFSLVFCILGGLYKVIPGIKALKNSQQMQEDKQAYEVSVKAYKQHKENLEKDILQINQDIERSELYNQNSILMQINPYQKNVAAMSLYVSTDYEIMPGMTYQNPDRTAQIVLAYMNSVNTGELYNYVLNNLNEKVELRYLKEVLTVNADTQNGMIFVEVVGRDKARCSRVFELVKENFAQNKELIKTKVAQHDMELLNESYYTTVDLQLEEKQQGNRDKVNLLNQTLNTKTDELKNIKEPKSSVISKGTVIKSSIKFMILGVIGGAGFAVLLVFFIDVMDARVRNAKDLRQKFGIKVLGTIPKGDKQNA